MDGSFEHQEWIDHDVLDANGHKIGTIQDLYYDEGTGKPEWLLVETGLFGTKRSFVPASHVLPENDKLSVSYTEERVKGAPKLDLGEELSEAQEQELYSYYGLDYSQSSDAVPMAPGTIPAEDHTGHRARRPSQCIHLGYCGGDATGD